MKCSANKAKRMFDKGYDIILPEPKTIKRDYIFPKGIYTKDVNGCWTMNFITVNPDTLEVTNKAQFVITVNMIQFQELNIDFIKQDESKNKRTRLRKKNSPTIQTLLSGS